MANFDTIKTAIDANINTNGTQEITGAVMNSVLNQMIDSTEENLTELESETSLNRFNQNKITNGKWQQPITGNIITLANYFISDYIPVKEGEVMFCTHGQGASCTIAQYDSSKTLITGTSQYFPVEGVTVVSGAKYIIVSAQTWVLGAYFMVASNGLPLDYWAFETASKPVAELFYNRMPKVYESREEQILSSINRFNKDSVTKDKWLQPSGAIITLTNSFVSDYIPVKEGEVINSNFAQQGNCTIAQYDSSKNLIEGTSQYFPTDGVAIVSGAKYIIVSAQNWVLGDMMVLSGNLPNVYITYAPNSTNEGYSIDKRYFEQIDTPIISKLVAISSVFEDGIFGGNLNSGFETSDYIEVTLNNAENYYFICKDNYSASALRFFDKDKNLIVAYKATDLPKEPIKLTFGKSVQYVRFSRTKASATGVYRMPILSFEEAVNGVVKSVNTENNNVLWLGTSIPEGATYPKVACQNNGYNCINKAKGSSRLGWYETPAASGDVTAGRSLTASVAELESFYRPYVTEGIIPESTLESWKQGSYENSVLPFINGQAETQVSMIVIDHGYNDHASINELMADKESIDWDSVSKDNFIGAFHFLVNEIQKINPFIKIVISGYFQNSGYVNGANICEIQHMIANQYRFQLMDAWNYTQIGQRGFIEGTSNYIENLNAQYGTSFNVPDWAKDSNGNIIALKMYCPDNIHPHSDPTGNTNKRLNAVYTKLLANSI